MSGGNVLSDKAVEELQAALRKVEQLMGTVKPDQRRRNIAVPAGGGFRRAFCKDYAGEGSTLDCYLDEDGTGEVVEVNFDILGPSNNLSAASPLLSDGDPIWVKFWNDAWYCTHPFDVTEECDCYEEP